MSQYKPAAQKTMYFIGVTTGQSSIMKVFPEWVGHLGVECMLKGIDFKPHSQPSAYREAVEFIKNDPLSLGALVTTHKIDLLKASRDLFDELDYYAEHIGEVSGISKQDGKLVGHAKDPITSGLSLEQIVPEEYWKTTRAEVFIIGAGGSSTALTMYLLQEKPQDDKPSRIVVSNRSKPRLEEMKALHKSIGTDIPIEYVHAPRPEDNDAIVKSLRDYSLVANATGLGKDNPGSPVTWEVQFPANGVVWDFNYRGDLLFLQQAQRQQQERHLQIEDGWKYFIYGWTQVMKEVLHIDIPTAGPEFEEISRIAQEARKKR
jgi:shikimate 5-dehydrogenase